MLCVWKAAGRGAEPRPRSRRDVCLGKQGRLEGLWDGKAQFAGNEIDHRGKTLVGVETTGFSLGRLNDGVDSLADGVGHTVGKVGQDLVFVVEKRGGDGFHRFQSATAHP